MRSLIFFIYLFFLCNTSDSVAISQLPTANCQLLTENWYQYQNDEIELTPILNKGNSYQNAFQWLDIWKYRNNYLCFQANTDLALFINNKLFALFKENDKQAILLNDIIKKMNLHYDRKPILLGFWNEKGHLPLNTLYLWFGSKKVQIESESVKAVTFNQLQNFLVLLIIIILLIITILKLFFPASLYLTLSLLKGLPSKNIIFKDQSEIINPYTFIGGTGFVLIVGITLYLGIFRGIINTEFIKINSGFWINLSSLIGLILFPYLIKYIAVFIFSLVYKIHKSSVTSYFYSINFNILSGFFMFLFLISYLIFPLVFFEILFKIEAILFLIFLGLKFLYLFFVLSNNYKFNKLHLFFYLCTLEVLPLLLIYKILGIQFGN